MDGWSNCRLKSAKIEKISSDMQPKIFGATDGRKRLYPLVTTKATDKLGFPSGASSYNLTHTVRVCATLIVFMNESINNH